MCLQVNMTIILSTLKDSETELNLNIVPSWQMIQNKWTILGKESLQLNLFYTDSDREKIGELESSEKI